MLNPDEFSVVDQGKSPLYYGRFGGLPRNRLGLVHPALELPVTPHHRSQNEQSVRSVEYFAPQALVGRGLNNRKLKAPKLVNNPSAAAPGTAGFADFVDIDRDALPKEQTGVYIDYVTRRRDLSGLSAASRLIRAVAASRPNAHIDLGKVLSPRVWTVGEELKEEGRDVRMSRYF